jgi:hypothetical protein
MRPPPLLPPHPCARGQVKATAAILQLNWPYLVGSGTGPAIVAPVVVAASIILSTALCSRSTQYDLSLMRIFCCWGGAAAAAVTGAAATRRATCTRWSVRGVASDLAKGRITTLLPLAAMLHLFAVGAASGAADISVDCMLSAARE